MEIIEKLIEMLRKSSAYEAVNIDSSLTTDIGLDSLGMVSLLVAVEDNFKIELNESDMDPFALQTVGDVVKLIKKYLEEDE